MGFDAGSETHHLRNTKIHCQPRETEVKLVQWLYVK